jgi:hypothetical protein
MGTSAFEILFVPILLATLGSLIAGAAILSAIRGIEALVGCLGRSLRAFKTAPRAAKDRAPRTRRALVRRVKSIG